jgi:hypothetical protein
MLSGKSLHWPLAAPQGRWGRRPGEGLLGPFAPTAHPWSIRMPRGFHARMGLSQTASNQSNHFGRAAKLEKRGGDVFPGSAPTNGVRCRTLSAPSQTSQSQSNRFDCGLTGVQNIRFSTG